MRKLECLRCGSAMRFGMQEKFQMGQTGWILGDLPNLIAGSLELEIYFCPQCGKVEFFTPEESTAYSHNDLPQKKCPKCGRSHDFDFPKCPYCDFDYYAR